MSFSTFIVAIWNFIRIVLAPREGTMPTRYPSQEQITEAVLAFINAPTRIDRRQVVEAGPRQALEQKRTLSSGQDVTITETPRLELGPSRPRRRGPVDF